MDSPDRDRSSTGDSPDEPASEESAPGESALEESAPGESALEESALEESAPGESAQAEPAETAGDDSADASTGGPAGLGARLGRYWDDDPALVGVVAIAVAGLFARLLWLGARSAHFDEARVAYFTLRFFESGHFEYRRIIHGPFIQHVNTWLWSVTGPSDFSSRLVVALVGAALPLVVLLFRRHLRDRELVIAAGFLAFNPILLYYSRFLRSDLLVATFMVAALGAFVRFAETRRVGWLYGSAALVGMGFASKENAVVYLLCYLGAGALVADTGLFRPRGGGSGWDVLGARYGRAREWYEDDVEPARETLVGYGAHVLGALALLFAVIVFFYAPRAGTVGTQPGLYQALGSPTLLPDVIGTTIDDIASGFETWFGHSSQPGCHKDSVVDAYGCYLYRFVRTMGTYAAPLSVFAVGGFVLERYRRGRSRWLVMFASYWGFVSVLGYPLATDIWAAWIVTHALVPLAIPAAVGLALFVDWGMEARADGDVVGSLLSVGLVVLVLTGMLWTGAMAAYVEPQTRSSPTDMVQFAQPSSDLDPAVRAMDAAIEGNQGVDVVWYGSKYVVEDESAADVGPAPANWYPRLPMPWYTEMLDAEVDSAGSTDAFEELLANDPPVVIVQADQVSQVDGRLQGYRRVGTFDLRANIGGPQEYSSVVVFVDDS